MIVDRAAARIDWEAWPGELLGPLTEAEIREQGFADFVDLWDRMPVDIRDRIRSYVDGGEVA